jgi:hypothetical protein
MFPIVFVALCIATASAPETATPATALSGAELDAFQQSYTDHRLHSAGWSGNFHQEVRSPDLLNPITSDGNLTYRAPATLEMTYTAPLEGQVWIRNNDVGQKFSGRAPQVAAQPMVRSLLDFFRQPPSVWQKDFATTAQRDHDLVRIQLTVKPGAAAGQPSRITVEVNATTLDPMRLEIVFAEQSSLTFIFTDWKSLGPPSATAPEPPANEPTPPPPRPRLPAGK